MMNQRFSRLRSNSSKLRSGIIQGELPRLKQPEDYSLRHHQMSRSEQLSSYRPQGDIEGIVRMFAAHYTRVQAMFKGIEVQLSQLQIKMADCFGKFNRIEWKLNKKVHQLQQSQLLNQELVGLNAQMEEKLEAVKTDYEEMKKKKYLSNLQRRLDELKEYVHRFEIEQYKNRFKKHQQVILEDNIDKLEQVVRKQSKGSRNIQREVYREIIGELIGLLRGRKEGGEWIQQKIEENIQLKFKVIKHSCGGCLNNSPQQGLSMAKVQTELQYSDPI